MRCAQPYLPSAINVGHVGDLEFALDVADLEGQPIIGELSFQSDEITSPMVESDDLALFNIPVVSKITLRLRSKDESIRPQVR